MTSKAILKRRHVSARPGILTFRNVALSFIGALCVAWSVIWIIRIVQNIGQPQMEYSESFMLYISHLFGAGTWSWNIAQANGGNMVSFYPPIFYWTLGHVMNLFGYSLVVGRLFELSVFTICLVFVFLIVHHLAGNRLYAALAALLPLTQPFVNTWSLFVRVDFMAIMFELAGIYIFLRFWKSPWASLSVLFFALAFYTKQSTIAGAAAVCIYILIKNWRYAIAYSSMLLLAIGIPLLAGSLATGGQFFNELVLYQRLSPMIRPSSEIRGFVSVAYGELLPIAFIAVIYCISYRKTLPAIFAAAAFVLSLIMITRPGGAQNYFFEVTLAMSIICGLALPEIIKGKFARYLIVFVMILFTLIYSSRLSLYPEPTYAANMKQAEALIQDANYPVLTENADIVISAGKVPYDEPFVFGNLPHFGYWNENPLLNDMRSGRMEYVITQYKIGDPDVLAYRFDSSVLQAVLKNYHIVLDDEDKNGYGFVIYKYGY